MQKEAIKALFIHPHPARQDASFTSSEKEFICGGSSRRGILNDKVRSQRKTSSVARQTQSQKRNSQSRTIYQPLWSRNFYKTTRKTMENGSENIRKLFLFRKKKPFLGELLKLFILDQHKKNFTSLATLFDRHPFFNLPKQYRGKQR